MSNEEDAVNNFKAITEVNDNEISVRYLSANEWDVSVWK